MTEKNMDLNHAFELAHGEVHFEVLEKPKDLFREFRVALFALGIALTVAMTGMLHISQKMVNDLRVKDFQINSLMDEVGELKEENLMLYQQVEQGEKTMEVALESVTELEGQVKVVDQEGVLGLQKKLDQLNSEYQSNHAALASLLNAGALGELSDQILNVLILGVNGRLTDTIMVASVNPATEKVDLISIPRDLTVDGRRINEYYYRYGIDAMRDKIEEITGLYPEKYIWVNLAGFEAAVDALGGIEVDVPKALTDYNYPGPNYTYETFSVEAGLQHMDGVTALKYARSRKSTSDFDRAARQQLIVDAVKKKALSFSSLSNVDELISVYNEVAESVETDVALWDMLSYLNQYGDFEIETGHVLTSSNYLYSTTGTNGAYLLLPRGGNYDQVKAYIQSVLTD